MAAVRCYFVFSFHEHEAKWTGTDQGMMQTAAQENWVLEETGASNAFEERCIERIETVELLRTFVRAMMVGGRKLPPQVVQLPFEKLKALIAREGWRFVGGDFLDFEADHNDTEIRVVLER
jgi:hypothetical protein